MPELSIFQKSLIQFIAAIFTLPLYLFSQENANVSIAAHFSEYRNKSLTEKLYVHTDRNFYMAGEILWWKLYYVDGSFHKPLDLSKVAYVEILDRNFKPVMQAKIALSKAGGSGSFYLPVSISSGNYILRAYTAWMKNFGADYFFEKQVTIVNSLKPMTPVPLVPSVYDIQFFPEGGNLVRNLESKVGFRATDQYGKGQAFSAFLLNEHNDTILSFSPLKFGIGHFTFTPTGSHSYKVLVKMPGGQTLQPALPVIYEEGYVMKVQDIDPANIKVTITTNLPVSQQKEILLFVHSRQIIRIAARAPFVNGLATFSIDKAKLGEGIAHLTVFDLQQRPVCERLYFQLPRHRLSMEMLNNNAPLGPRNKVSLSLKTNAGDSGSAAASISVSVYRLDEFQGLEQDDILSYLWLTSDLKGSIESPDYYFSHPGPEAAEATDNLMLTHGWRRFTWEKILAGKSTLEWVPEFDGHIIKGVIKNAVTNLPAPNITCYLTVAGQQVQFYHSESDSSGEVKFDVRDYYGQSELVLKTEDENSINDYRVEIRNPFSETHPGRNVIPFMLPESQQTELNKASIGMQVQNAYAGEKLSRFHLPGIDSSSFYGQHGKVYKLDDYTRFTTMEEVLREYVYEVGVRRRNGQLHLVVADYLFRGFYDGEPLLLLDGVPVSHEKILNFDPMKVKKLQVIANKYIRGNFVYDGVVSFSTYHGNIEDLQLDAKTVTLEYEGLQLKREFFSPMYETELQINSRIPDFRHLLYWSPDVNTDSKGNAKVEFYTSDITGKFVAVFQGMDAGGNAGSFYYTFDVSGKPGSEMGR